MTTDVTLSFTAVTVDSADPAALADFWGKALGRPVSPGAVAGDTAIDITGSEGGPRMILHKPKSKSAKNSVHLVLITANYEQEIERLTGLGARPLNEAKLQGVIGDQRFAVRETTFADPQGNEFELVIWQPEGQQHQ
jgi:glyoxalase superfamily protein